MSNRLAEETSPYLLQHRDNPVQWLPWGEKALELARERDVPLLVSIGYSACHWCHVMERESFEDPETARYMNEHFVPVKVDREERPDVDAIYMEAVQAMTGHGGWPMTVFSDTDGTPFYGGTYFPPEPRGGMPSFRMVMEAVYESWQTKREQIREAGGRIRDRLSAIARVQPQDELPAPDAVDGAIEGLRSMLDRRDGGFGEAPKFPPASALELMLGHGLGEEAGLTLDGMARGGIYDQIGGGFARYSVDAHWLVPHFEKMLYDNALLARAYLHGWQETGNERWRRVVTETLDWALREMRGPEGAFFSALDADSEGEEGRFYVWTPDQIREALQDAGLGEVAEGVIEAFGVTEAGNFEGRNVLHLPGGPRAAGEEERPGGLDRETFDRARLALREARAERVWPDLDDKRLTAWNALAIAALADAGAVLGREDYLDAARRCASFLLSEMRDSEGRLLRTWRDGEARLNAYLEDHAFSVEALVVLYEATFEPDWLRAARELAGAMIERFADPERGGLFTTSSDHERLIVRRKDVDDHPIPSGNSSAAMGLLRLSALTGDPSYEEHAIGVLRLFGFAAVRHPQALPHLLRALDFHLSPRREVALVAPAGSQATALAQLAEVVRSRFRPNLVLAGGSEGAREPELLRDRGALDGRPTAYVCERFACQAPTTDAAELERTLDAP